MKKYLYSALALPLLFACSDELIEKQLVSNDPFPGVEKVNATFYMDEDRASTRMDQKEDGTYTGWTLAEGDMYGFAWLGDGDVINDGEIDGLAYQNHPLTQTEGIFKPMTSIYVGKYYIYRPYDETVVSPEAIHFNSLKEQNITDGQTGDNWKALAVGAINIGDKWTEVTKPGWTDADGKKWDEAGIKKHYKIYAAVFSNQTGLDLSYEKNNVGFGGKKAKGATDIDYTYPENATVGAAFIKGGTVKLPGSANSFTYAPETEPVDWANVPEGEHNGEFWADKDDLGEDEGFTFPAGDNTDVITLKTATGGITTATTNNKGWFWFNSLPIKAGNGTLANTQVTTTLQTTYGDVTVTALLKDCAYVYDQPKKGTNAWTKDDKYEWINLVEGQNNPDNITLGEDKKIWNIDNHNTFINQYGNHKGKYALTVDFSKADMNNMHIENDTHLQQALKFYIASNKQNNEGQENIVLNLDGDDTNSFKLSKISIALLQTINAAAGKPTVKVQGCDEVAHNAPVNGRVKIIVTQEGQAGVTGLDGKTEVPELDNVFAAPTHVYLAANTTWTWSGNYDFVDGTHDNEPLPIDANVTALTNLGTITVNATNVQLSEADVKIYNAEGATMNITKVTTVKNTLHNYGTLNVGSASNKTAELRAYGPKWIVNNATSLTKHGVINNFGVVGVTAGTNGQFNNYGLINMMHDDAITLLTSNEKGTDPFKKTFDSSTNKMGTVVLPEGNPYAIVSVSNQAENGFIKYNWTAATYAHDPDNVKYNTLVVSGNIEFTGDVAATEIQFIEFDGTNRALVVNPAAASKLTNLKGIIVKDNSSIVIEKTNEINCKVGAFLGEGATVYKGGAFTVDGAAFATPTNTTMYLGTWSLDQIVEY